VKVPERVNVEVPVPCVKPADVPARPQLRTEADLMAMDRYRRTLAVWSDWLKLQVYAAKLEAIATGCSRTNVFVAPALDELAYASRPSNPAPRVAAGERHAIAQAFAARVIVRALPRASSPALVTADRESIGYHPRL
jgi:hypothetical protein